ncbi:MAG: hypothetical protein HYR76_05405 [Ignavibacteria bacterium]|nr:hypothetical protein [Ignavibacteria bacterium]MBI3765449.1 hypothetical protein [Ignavibacteriales bacterium]
MVVNISCKNPFAPKLETTSATQLCTDLTQIENVFCTFRNAYAFKDTTTYGSIVADDFTFSYRDYDRGVDVSWGRVDEMRSTYGLFQSVQSLNLIWNNQISSDSGEIRRTIIRGFNFTVTFNPGDIERVDGYANLTFGRATVNDPWKIVHWRDESNF